MKTLQKIVLLCCLLPLFGAWWEWPFDAEAFEKKVQSFRFGLYPLLDQPEPKYDLFFSKPVQEAIQKFAQENQTDILKYRLHILKRHQEPAPDLTHYQLWKTQADISLRHLSFPPGKQLWEMDPRQHVYMAHYSVIGRLLQSSQMAALAMKNGIAGHRFSTQPQQDKWIIWLNYYDYLYRFEYEPQQALLANTQVWKRTQAKQKTELK